MTPLLPAHDRVRRILEDLEAVRENLLALSDDIWQSIEHNDPRALEEGVEFKRRYNEKMAAFDALASELSDMVQGFTSVRLEQTERGSTENRDENERIVRELDREQPYTLDKDFTFRRPHGFVLDGQAATGITTWRRLYELVCQQLARRDLERFRALPENTAFISNRGHREFHTNAAELRSPMLVAEGIHAEINHSANALRDLLRELLPQFSIPLDQLRIYLREDRDAERQRE
ncbi:MAG TPA: hypothetical protein VNH11_10040 [Pirellulales bacterium]|nr:hypothetical protein [Pirellulales bacterium]